MFICTILFLIASCSTVSLEISESDHDLLMVGGKQSLLNAIVYPEFALEKGIEGTVTVLAYVDTAGAVRECRILQGNDYLNEAAREAVRKQRFYPYILNGKKRPVRVAIPIVFRISREFDLRAFESENILQQAGILMDIPLRPLGRLPAQRSPGENGEYYSEGFSWCPDPRDPAGPYVFREGEKNSDAFRAHADALNEAGNVISGLTVAYMITNRREYAERAAEHLRAWFIDPAGRMAPHLRYAQAIPGRSAGRDLGIYEGLPLAEIVRSLEHLAPVLNDEERKMLNRWFREYLGFLTTDKFGVSVRERMHAYGAAGLLQTLAIADYLGEREKFDTCLPLLRERYLPRVLSVLPDPGKYLGFPDDLFIHSDIFSAIALLYREHDIDIWNQEIAGGETPDVLVRAVYDHFIGGRPLRSPEYDGRYLSLLFAGKSLKKNEYIELWLKMQYTKEQESVFPLRQPLLWLEKERRDIIEKNY